MLDVVIVFRMLGCMVDVCYILLVFWYLDIWCNVANIVWIYTVQLNLLATNLLQLYS